MYPLLKKRSNITILKRGKKLCNASYKSVTQELFNKTYVLYQIPLRTTNVDYDMLTLQGGGI